MWVVLFAIVQSKISLQSFYKFNESKYHVTDEYAIEHFPYFVLVGPENNRLFKQFIQIEDVIETDTKFGLQAENCPIYIKHFTDNGTYFYGPIANESQLLGYADMLLNKHKPIYQNAREAFAAANVYQYVLIYPDNKLSEKPNLNNTNHIFTSIIVNCTVFLRFNLVEDLLLYDAANNSISYYKDHRSPYEVFDFEKLRQTEQPVFTFLSPQINSDHIDLFEKLNKTNPNMKYGVLTKPCLEEILQLCPSLAYDPERFIIFYGKDGYYFDSDLIVQSPLRQYDEEDETETLSRFEQLYQAASLIFDLDIMSVLDKKYIHEPYRHTNMYNYDRYQGNIKDIQTPAIVYYGNSSHPFGDFLKIATIQTDFMNVRPIKFYVVDSSINANQEDFPDGPNKIYLFLDGPHKKPIAYSTGASLYRYLCTRPGNMFKLPSWLDIN